MKPRMLEELVTSVASLLTATQAETWVASAEQVLHEVVDYFGLDVCFLRRNDHEIGATVLVAEWPRRENKPDPDPLDIVYFADAGPEFASAENLKDVILARPGGSSTAYQDRVGRASGILAASMVAVPLLSGEVTTGTLGFVKFGDREWSTAEINVLKAIAALLTQVQERVRAENSLHYWADHDELTGLANRHSLLDQLNSRMAPGSPGPVAILFLDLDRLKSLNDFLGHSAGDRFIVEIGARLTGRCTPDALVARLGGDEFVVVLGEGVGLDDARREAERISEFVNEWVLLGNVTFSRSASIGIAVGMPGDCTAADLLWQADQAVIGAKAQGGNAIVAFTEDMREEIEIRNIIELSLKSSITDDWLHLVYQPEVDLRTGEILAVEALVRWDHPVLGLLLPQSFISVAESTNLAGELGAWVLGRACREYAQWRAGIPGLDVTLRVNVSPAQLVGLEFLDMRLARIFRRTGSTVAMCAWRSQRTWWSATSTEREWFCRGLPTSVCGWRSTTSGRGTARWLSSSSCGSTCSRSTVSSCVIIGNSPSGRAIVESIVGLAKSFDLDLVAEGVEQKVAARALLELGCHRAQGYLLSRPVSAERCGELLRAGRIRVGDPQPSRA